MILCGIIVRITFGVSKIWPFAKRRYRCPKGRSCITWELVMKVRKWSIASWLSLILILGLLFKGAAEPRPCFKICSRASLNLYSVRPGINSRISRKDAKSTKIARTCLRVSQLVACWYVSANACRYFPSADCFSGSPNAFSTLRDDCTASHRCPASPGVMTSKAAAIAVAALRTYTFFLCTSMFSQLFWGWPVTHSSLPQMCKNWFSFSRRRTWIVLLRPWEDSLPLLVPSENIALGSSSTVSSPNASVKPPLLSLSLSCGKELTEY